MNDGCQAHDEDLSALLDGELAPERAAAVRAHADGCERCAGRLAQLARVDALLLGAPAPALPASLRARLEARIAVQSGGGARSHDTSLRERAAARAPRRAWRGRVASAVAAAAAGVALYLAVASREPAPQTGAPSPVQVARPKTAPAQAAPELARRESAPPVQPMPPVARPVAPAAQHQRPPPPPVAPETIARRPEPARPAPAPIDLESVPDEDLGIALELDTVEDYDEIANLELLELMLANEAS